MRISYEQALKDHATLWAIGPAYDMTGGYTDSEDLERLLKSPNKSTARKCLVQQIQYWLETGTEEERLRRCSLSDIVDNHPEVGPIADRYGYEY